MLYKRKEIQSSAYAHNAKRSLSIIKHRLHTANNKAHYLEPVKLNLYDYVKLMGSVTVPWLLGSTTGSQTYDMWDAIDY